MTKLKLGPIFACKTSLVADFFCSRLLSMLEESPLKQCTATFYGARAREETLMSVMILYEYELMFIAHV